MDLKKAFKLLGIKQNSTSKQIKKAYRKKAGKIHPDKHQDDLEESEEDFKELSDAYQTAMEHSDNVHRPKLKTSTSQKEHRNEFNSPEDHFERFSSTFKDDFFERTLFDIIRNLFGERRRPLDIQRSQRQVFSNPRTSQSRRTCGVHDEFTVCLKCK